MRAMGTLARVRATRGTVGRAGRGGGGGEGTARAMGRAMGHYALWAVQVRGGGWDAGLCVSRGHPVRTTRALANARHP